MMKWSVVLGVSFWVMGLMPSEVGPAYPNNNNDPTSFLPETSGGTPDCVQDPRDTFCTDPKKYPKDRILYLLKNKMFDMDSMFLDESRDSYIFISKDAPPPVTMYGYDPLQTYDGTRQNYEPPIQTYDAPRQSFIPPSQSYGPPPPSPSLPSSGYLPPQHNNYSTASKPFHLPPPPPLPPPTKYGPPITSYGGAPYHYGSPAAPVYDNEGPYPRYRKNTTPPSTYLTRFVPPPPPRAPPKQQPWLGKHLRSSRRRQKRQITGTEELCSYVEDYITARSALSTKGDWMFLVNVEGYSQQVKTKKCIEGASCSGSCNVPGGFTTSCEQQYAQKRLVALDGSGRILRQDTFWFPVCCLCTIVPA